MEISKRSVAALFQPFALKNVALPNRIVMAPMTRGKSPGGVPGPDVAAYYRRRAEGGVGLVVTEGTFVGHVAAGFDPNIPRFYRDDALNGWKHVVEEVHAAGGRIVPQLWHVGAVHQPHEKSVEGAQFDGGSGSIRALRPRRDLAATRRCRSLTGKGGVTACLRRVMLGTCDHVNQTFGGLSRPEGESPPTLLAPHPCT